MGDNNKDNVLLSFVQDLATDEVFVTLCSLDNGEVVCQFVGKPMKELSEDIVYDD